MIHWVSFTSSIYSLSKVCTTVPMLALMTLILSPLLMANSRWPIIYICSVLSSDDSLSMSDWIFDCSWVPDLSYSVYMKSYCGRPVTSGCLFVNSKVDLLPVLFNSSISASCFLFLGFSGLFWCVAPAAAFASGPLGYVIVFCFKRVVLGSSTFTLLIL